MFEDPPRFDRRRAEEMARELFGCAGTARELSSERDQNFLVAVDGEPKLVVKIANASEDRAFLAAEQRAMQHVAQGFGLTPRVLAMRDGATLGQVAGADGRVHLVWAVTALGGVPLAGVRHRTPELFERFGAAIAELTRAFEGFDEPALHRDFHWDLARGRGVVERFRPLIADRELGAAIDVLIRRFDEHTARELPALPRSVIHGDLNDHNVLVGGADGAGDDLFERGQRVAGFVDFGDMVHGVTVGELAIAVAYAMLDAADPLSVMWHMASGYRRVRALDAHEMRALFGLAALRLCTSACVAAEQQRRHPDNAYLGVTQAALRRTLPRLARIPFGVAAATVRSAHELEPIEASAAVRAWLGARTAQLAPVLGIDLGVEPCLVLDLGVGSPLVSGDARDNDEPAFTERVFGAMRRAGVRVAVGRYDEPRLLYVTPAFAAGDGTLDEHRTIHLGLDLFAAAGTPVHAPLDGEVVAADEHKVRLDYGGVIVLRHRTDDGVEFFTLYGHLSRASFGDLRVGQRVARGERIARLGAPDDNGGWTPHLHLQIICDFLGLGSDFPGVSTPGRRDVWLSVSPDPNLIVGIPRDQRAGTERSPAHRAPARGFGNSEARDRRNPMCDGDRMQYGLLAGRARSLREAQSRRARLIGPSVRLAYRRPLRLVRGWRQYVYDDDGRRYLDAYNNVPHVGHCHPRVVEAVAHQMAVLNTNTRYLQDALDDYAERLTQTLPEPLRLCFVVSSASEANELAIRLARAYTERRDLLVLDAAYHGNTTTLIDISPYKHAGPGGLGAPDWVHTAPLADDYRGPYKRGARDAGARYAADAARAVDTVGARGRALAGFIAESCPSVGGQIIFPDGYLAGVYEAVRGAGGVCIADEVQTGLGRIGTHFWAFESQGVVPDIVVMGKPLGNGHPLAAVVTTRAIADAFDGGMEYFSTFGGNTVSCAAGAAVLDVMRDEQLQAHARAVGDALLAALRELAARHALVGDVRGAGLFVGVELVRDRATLAPAAAEASYVVNRMRDEGILLGSDGPHHNVLKIRPPMPFDAGDAARVVETLDRVLGELA
jgi:4-aminobutyrate aminotransferase-like enzyme/Ser/Thr protein kinase RdoA (MazF antagonist)/murein DD-endopeptidase MepM/ murein hydrolase activator NlpD